MTGRNGNKLEGKEHGKEPKEGPFHSSSVNVQPVNSKKCYCVPLNSGAKLTRFQPGRGRPEQEKTKTSIKHRRNSTNQYAQFPVNHQLT
eukprot:1063035-Pelagomonas_calceolata.AAC.2